MCLSVMVAHYKHNLEKGRHLRVVRVLHSWPTLQDLRSARDPWRSLLDKWIITRHMVVKFQDIWDKEKIIQATRERMNK